MESTTVGVCFAAYGVVTADRKPAVVLYALNRQHLAADGIVALANLRDAFIRHLSETVDSWALRPVQVTLFGSAARGDMRADSDIDLFIVRPRRVQADNDQWRTQVDELASKATNWTGNDLRVLQYAEVEFARLQPQKDPVFDTICADGIVLLSDFGRRRHPIPRKAR